MKDMTTTQFLLNQNAELREQRAGLMATIEGLRASNAKMREALNRYADPNNWEPTTSESTRDGCGCTDFWYWKPEPGVVIQVGGKAARESLKETGEER